MFFFLPRENPDMGPENDGIQNESPQIQGLIISGEPCWTSGDVYIYIYILYLNIVQKKLLSFIQLCFFSLVNIALLVDQKCQLIQEQFAKVHVELNAHMYYGAAEVRGFSWSVELVLSKKWMDHPWNLKIIQNWNPENRLNHPPWFYWTMIIGRKGRVICWVCWEIVCVMWSLVDFFGLFKAL